MRASAQYRTPISVSANQLSIPSPTRLPLVPMDPIEPSRHDDLQINPPKLPSNAKVSKRKRAPARDRLSGAVLLDLWSIWQANPRIPSIKSRRAWAISRNAAPRLVHSWFLRRGRDAKKAGEAICEEPYELPLEPYLESETLRSTQERSSPAPFDFPSDDTLVSLDDDALDRMEASSDTVWDECAASAVKVIKPRAYTEVLPKEDCDLPQQSSNYDYTPEDLLDEYTLVSDDPPYRICNQDRGEKSNGFTRILSSKKLLKGIRKKKRDCFTTISCSAENSHITAPQPLRLEIPPDTLMELSAIPFLFRTPIVVAPENPKHQDMDGWMALEDELGQLVREGKLDFSFLDAPGLTSMELPD